jgi:hypothetical protein
MLSRFGWLYLAALALLAAQIAAMIWAHEIRDWETKTLDALGIPGPVRVAGLALLLGWLGYRYYVRGKREAAQHRRPMVRRSVAIFALGSLALVLVLVLLALRD